MNRDITVPLSLFIIIFMFLLDFIYEGIFLLGDTNTFVAKLFGLLPILVVIRIIILWFQTFIHAVKSKSEQSRVKWLIGHLVLVFVASYLYYFINNTNEIAVRPKIASPN